MSFADIGALDAVEHRAAHERDTSTDGVDARVGSQRPHRQVEVEVDGRASTPWPRDANEAVAVGAMANGTPSTEIVAASHHAGDRKDSVQGRPSLRRTVSRIRPSHG